MQNVDVKNKALKTIFDNFGVLNVFSNKNIQNKIKSTLKEKYGFEYTSQVPEIKEKMKVSNIERGNWMPDELRSEWDTYFNAVRSETYKHIDELYNIWETQDNFVDAYTGECMKDSMSVDPHNRLAPTIDHKISKHYGFNNNIPPEKIGSLSNLCITQLWVNSKKKIMNADEFIRQLEFIQLFLSHPY